MPTKDLEIELLADKRVQRDGEEPLEVVITDAGNNVNTNNDENASLLTHTDVKVVQIIVEFTRMGEIDTLNVFYSDLSS